jgi:hypothetical protein
MLILFIFVFLIITIATVAALPYWQFFKDLSNAQPKFKQRSKNDE